MKRLLVISYWALSILVVSIIVTSLGYSFAEALLIGTMFLPGALAARFFFPKVDFKNKWAGIKDSACIVLGILIAEIMLFFLADRYIAFLRDYPQENPLPLILTNPLFITLVLTITQAKPQPSISKILSVG